jgi:hypothetical protein
MLVAAAGLAACGGSSSSSTTASNAAATSSAGTPAPAQAAPQGSSSAPPALPPGATGATGATGLQNHFGRPGSFAAHFASIRECLSKQGVTLPTPTPGQGTTERPYGGPGGFGGGAGAKLPNGITRTQFQAAMQKCGGRASLPGRLGGGPGGRLNSTAYRAALAKFATCMREQGVNLPAPSTSGGPIFDTKGLNTHSPQFLAALSKCRLHLRGAYTPGAATAPQGP